MRRASSKRSFAGPGFRLVGFFLVFILLPGVVLAVFALRTLQQEERFAHQQIRERLERAAARVARELDLQFGQWREGLRSIRLEEMTDPRAWPECIRPSVEAPESSVLVMVVGERVHAFPPGRLLYEVTATFDTILLEEPLPAAAAQAESVELVQRDYPRAIRLYQALVGASNAALQPLVLHRLARSYHKAGRLDEALGAYRRLENLGPARIGTLPADLIARSGVCALSADGGDSAALRKGALELYSDLADGRWSLERPRYLYYSEQARSWIRESGAAGEEEFKRIEALERRKAALTGAVEEFLPKPKTLLFQDAERYVAFWEPEPLRAIVLSVGSLAPDLWARVLAAADDPGVDAALYFSDGELVFGLPTEEAPSPGVMHTFQLDTSSWRLLVWPREPVALQADLARRRNLYQAMLIFVVALLSFGGYITARAVKRELEVARMRSEFVSMVSHEFRSPLTGIRLLAEMLVGGRVAGEERRHRYHQMIVEESKRLGRLVENLLDLSRMEEGREEYRIAPLKTSVWLRELVANFQLEIDGKGVFFAADIPEDLPTISADREALACAVHNLLDNAVKYSPESKTVWLDAGVENGSFTISVRDRGVGIPEPDLQHIFEKFYRVDGAISQQVKGAGLGLSLVKKIVTAHGGVVECRSRPGEGSTFFIRLPVAGLSAGG
jgi:signal transduction histidine kinase